MKYYAEQHDRYRLGNFIMMTPALQMAADHLGYPIPTVFHQDYVKDCYRECPFIEIVPSATLPGDELINHLVGSNQIHNTQDNIAFYRNIVSKALKIPDAPTYHTYIDRPLERIYEGRYVVFLRGTGNERKSYWNRKALGEDFYKQVIDYLQLRNYECVLTGSQEDYNRFKEIDPDTEFDYIQVGDIRKSLALIAGASLVISNDTGLAHATTALKVPQMVCYMHTSPVKNPHPGVTTCVTTEDYFENFLKWYEARG